MKVGAYRPDVTLCIFDRTLKRSPAISSLTEEKVLKIAMEMKPATRPYWRKFVPVPDFRRLCLPAPASRVCLA